MPVPASPSCALLVLSCDAYSDLWRPFFTLLRRHWPDCPFPIYLGTGELDCAEPGVTTLKSGAGRDWSGCLRDYLQQIPERHVLIMLEDFFLRRRVDTALIAHCLEFAASHDAIQVRLLPRPGATRPCPDSRVVGESERASPYRLSTQAAIWNRDQLLALLRPGESAWDFEHAGNARADAFSGGFYAVHRTALPYDGPWVPHVVEKGLWFPHEKWIFRRADVGCDFSRRGTLPWSRTLFYHTAWGVELALNPLGWRRKQRIKRALRRWLQPLLGRRLDSLRQPRSPASGSSESPGKPDAGSPG
jgi:hypothetical protein